VQKQGTLEQQFYSVQKKVDTTFLAWVMKRYSSLHNLPPIPPVMLHHIAHDIAQYMQTAPKEKVALIIMDGLAFDQWIVLREVFSQIEITYRKGLGEGTSLSEFEELLSHPKLRVAGFIIDTVDKIVHGMELGTAGIHNQVRQWATQGFMIELFNLLLQNHFAIF